MAYSVQTAYIFTNVCCILKLEVDKLLLAKVLEILAVKLTNKVIKKRPNFNVF